MYDWHLINFEKRQRISTYDAKWIALVRRALPHRLQLSCAHREIEDGCSSGLPARLAGRLSEHASVFGSHPLPALSLAFFEIV
jgi:hypothetical protein